MPSSSVVLLVCFLKFRNFLLSVFLRLVLTSIISVTIVFDASFSISFLSTRLRVVFVSVGVYLEVFFRTSSILHFPGKQLFVSPTYRPMLIEFSPYDFCKANILPARRNSCANRLPIRHLLTFYQLEIGLQAKLKAFSF